MGELNSSQSSVHLGEGVELKGGQGVCWAHGEGVGHAQNLHLALIACTVLLHVELRQGSLRGAPTFHLVHC